jgi:SlyX protein
VLSRRLSSNTAMEPLHRIDRRLTDLEVKACFTEDLVDALNRLVTRQQDQIDSLTREIGRLRQQGADAEPAGFRSLRDELPPHY